MKNRILLVLTVLLCFISKQSIAQTTVAIHLSDGTEQTFTISEAGKIYFDDGSLFITEEGNTYTQRPISSIKKITFKENDPNSIENQNLQNKTLFIYPNPANEYINISYPKNEVEIYVYTIEGRLLLKKSINTSEPLNVSELTQGVYLVKINDETVKLIKQ